jgi:hypothetical protein
VNGVHHQRGLVGVEDDAQSDHAVLEDLVAEVAAIVEARAGRRHVGDLADLAADPLELRAGAGAGQLEKVGLVLRGGHPGEGADLGVGERAPLERAVDVRERPERAGHAHLLARGSRVEADAPAEPVRAADRPLALPLARLIEGADAGEQPVGGGVEVRGGAGDLVGEGGGIGWDIGGANEGEHLLTVRVFSVRAT